MKNCIFCSVGNDSEQKVIFSNRYCMFLQRPQEVLTGSGIIIPKEHRETVFDLSENEWSGTFELLQEVKQYLDMKYKPQGYNVGWNVGSVGGQEVFHAHLHVIPRFEDESMAGKGIRYWLKQPQNKREGGLNMQKLILTSAGFENKKIGNKFLELVNISKDKIKAIFIPTAALTEEAKAFVPLCKKDLIDAGVLEDNIVVYDLDRIMSSDEICNFNVIYVCGGTTQHLLNKMNEAEFNIPLKRFLENGGVYIGVSAGSVVMANNLPHYLGYINCILNVHAKEGTECGHIDTSHCPTIKLTDNQAVIIEDKDIYIME